MWPFTGFQHLHPVVKSGYRALREILSPHLTTKKCVINTFSRGEPLNRCFANVPYEKLKVFLVYTMKSEVGEC